MKYEMGLTGEDRPSVGQVHSSISHRVRDFCHFLADVLFLNTVLKVLILKLLLLSDPIRCPVAPGAHVKMKPVYFPRRGFGYFSILLFRDVSPLFQKAGGVFQPSFPAGRSEPFRTGFGEIAGFRAAQGERGVVLGGAGARVCRIPKFHCQGVSSSARERWICGGLIAYRRFIRHRGSRGGEVAREGGAGMGSHSGAEPWCPAG